MWPFNKKEAPLVFRSGGIVDPIVYCEPSKEPEISQPVAAILKAMDDRPDDFILSDDAPYSDPGRYLSIHDTLTGVKIVVRRYFDRSMTFNYTSYQSWLSAHESMIVFSAAAKHHRRLAVDSEKIERARICSLYNVTTPQTPDN
jgi:hypothetical protein